MEGLVRSLDEAYDAIELKRVLGSLPKIPPPSLDGQFGLAPAFKKNLPT